MAVLKVFGFIAAIVMTVLITLSAVGGAFSQVEIITDPPGGTIWYNTNNWGPTPYKKNVSEGSWELRIEKDGFLTKTTTVTTVHGQPVRQEFKLIPVGSTPKEVIKLSTSETTLIAQEGRVEVLRAGSSQWIRGELGMMLLAGDRLRTLESSRATLRMKDATYRLTEFSTIEFLPEPRAVSTVLRGAMYFFSRDRAKDFQLKTRPATAAMRG